MGALDDLFNAETVDDALQEDGRRSAARARRYEKVKGIRVHREENLKAIFPVAVTPDLYDAAYHHGLLNSSFDAPFMSAMGVTGLLELPPAGTLTGIAKRNMDGVEVFSLNAPDQLAEARLFVERHSDAEAHHHRAANVSWLLATSPAKGELTIAEDAAVDAEVPAGAVIGRVSNTLGDHDIVAEHGGRIVEWLVESTDIVRPGQPLVRLYPSTEDL